MCQVWSSSCVCPGSCLQAHNDRTIGLSSIDENITMSCIFIIMQDTNTVILIEEHVWILLKDSSNAHWEYIKHIRCVYSTGNEN